MAKDVVKHTEEMTGKLSSAEVDVASGKTISLSTKITMTIKTFLTIVFALYSTLVTYGYLKQKTQIDELKTKTSTELKEIRTEMNTGFDDISGEIGDLRLDLANTKGDVKVIDDRTKNAGSRYERKTFVDNVPGAEVEIPEEVTK